MAGTDEKLVIVPSLPEQDEKLRKLVEMQDERPAWAADTSIDERFKDPLELPSWCSGERSPAWCKDNSYAWIDKNDKWRPLEVMLDLDGPEKWQVVTRMNHNHAPDSAFRLTGAVERGGLILVFRPAWLDKKIRDIALEIHLDTAGGLEGKFSGVRGIGENSGGKNAVVFETPAFTGPNGVVAAYEEAGQEGLIKTAAAQVQK